MHEYEYCSMHMSFMNIASFQIGHMFGDIIFYLWNRKWIIWIKQSFLEILSEAYQLLVICAHSYYFNAFLFLGCVVIFIKRFWITMCRKCPKLTSQNKSQHAMITAEVCKKSNRFDFLEIAILQLFLMQKTKHYFCMSIDLVWNKSTCEFAT